MLIILDHSFNRRVLRNKHLYLLHLRPVHRLWLLQSRLSLRLSLTRLITSTSALVQLRDEFRNREIHILLNSFLFITHIVHLFIVQQHLRLNKIQLHVVLDSSEQPNRLLLIRDFELSGASAYWICDLGSGENAFSGYRLSRLLKNRDGERFLLFDQGVDDGVFMLFAVSSLVSFTGLGSFFGFDLEFAQI